MTRRTVPLVLLAMGGLGLVASPAVAARPAPPAVEAPGGPLPLGPAGLAETRTTRTLQPGVTLTRIVGRHLASRVYWPVEVASPAALGSPEPHAPSAAIRD